jgi:hypothetical protein
MDREQIAAEWVKFIEYPGEDNRFVTTTSALLFAEHIAKLQASDPLIVKGAMSGVVGSQINDRYPTRSTQAAHSIRRKLKP